MDRTAAIAAATNALGGFSTQVSPADWEAALGRSVIPDAAGRWPTNEQWVASYEPYWLAAEVVEMAELRAMSSGQVKRWTSEGTTVEETPANLLAFAAGLRARSTIVAAPQVLGELAVPTTAGEYDTRSQGWDGAPRPGVIGNWS